MSHSQTQTGSSHVRVFNHGCWAGGIVVFRVRTASCEIRPMPVCDYVREYTDFASMSDMFLPVSRTDDNRLLANTSGATSLKICFVAKTRRIRANFSGSTFVGAAISLTCMPWKTFAG